MNRRLLRLPHHPVTSHPATPCSRRRGLGLVELLISLAIVASLLTAVAVGTHASFQAYAVNQEFSSLTQKTRIAMHRMIGAIRTSDHHQVTTNPAHAGNLQFKAGIDVVGAASIAMFDNAGTLHVYRYDAATKTLLSDVQPAGGTLRTHTMLEGVEKFEVTLRPMKSPAAARTGGDFDLLRRATILLTVRSTGSANEAGDGGTQTVTLSSSVVPRRNVW